MKKIGIMSMQRIYNYGSFLQAYALKQLIEEIIEDVDVSFIDYRPGEILIKQVDGNSNGLKRKLEKLREYGQVNSSFKDKIKFFNHKRTYGKRFYPVLGISEEPNYNNELDVLVIGSDEVFNCVQANTNVGYSRDLFGRDSKAKRIISYAGSFGNTTIEKIQDYQIEENLRKDFGAFHAVSVRDLNSYNIIKEMGIKEPVINVDPVLAYDYMSLERKIPENRLFEKDYMIVYGYSGRLTNKENELVKEYAIKKELKILCFGGIQDCCDEFIDCNPFELLAYFRDAEAIITDTFHGAILSIINNRPFGALIRKSSGLKYGNEEKLGYLLENLGLSMKQINKTEDIEKVISTDVDWSAVNHVLKREREKSIEYLRENIT